MFDVPKWGDDIPNSNINFGKGSLKPRKKLKTPDVISSAPSVVLKESKQNKKRKTKQNKDLQNTSFTNSNATQNQLQYVTLSVSKLKKKIKKKKKNKNQNNTNAIETDKGSIKTVVENVDPIIITKKNKKKLRKRKHEDSIASVTHGDNNNALSLKQKESNIFETVKDTPNISETIKNEDSVPSAQARNNDRSLLKPKHKKKKKQHPAIFKDTRLEIIKNTKKSKKRKHEDSNPNITQEGNDGELKPKNKKKKSELLEDTSAISESLKDNKTVKTNVTPVNREISRKKEKIKMMLQMASHRDTHINVSSNNLRERMLDKLKAAQFRFLNEKLYTTSGSEAQKLFQSDPEAFNTYHQGYQQQVKKWPVNPLDIIVKRISKMPKAHIIADMGCGEAALSSRVQQKVRSFDLVSSKPEVEACDMAHTPLLTDSVDVAVYCLALMGTDLTQYLMEASRVLKMGGHLLIAEVESRFDKVETFTEEVQRLGFKLKNLDKSHKVFFFMEFTKVRDPPKKKSKLPSITLKPCLYKKR